MMSSGQLRELHDRISGPLAEIQDLFKPGVKVTLLVRTPGFPDGARDVLVTDEDDLELVIAAIQARQAGSVTIEKMGDHG